MVTVLDGGLATLLEARGHDLGTGHLWSARLLATAEGCEAIRAAHGEFIEAGAEVSTTASYQASAAGFLSAGINCAGLIERSVEAARAASKGSAGLVAGSVGPFGACLADGSEYTGRYGRSRARPRLPGEAPDKPAAPEPGKTAALVDDAIGRASEVTSAVAEGALGLEAVPWLVQFQAPRCAALASAGCDVLAMETLPCAADAVALAAVANALRHPCWVSFSVGRDGTHLVSGEPLAAACAAALSVPGLAVVGVGVNCCHPSAVSRALAALGAVVDRLRPSSGAASPHVASGGRSSLASAVARCRRGDAFPTVLLAYPNAGEAWDAAARDWVPVARGEDGATPGLDDWRRLAEEWKAAAAGHPLALGGCCRAGPDVVAVLRAAADAQRPASNVA